MAEDGISVAWEGLNKLYEAIEKAVEEADKTSREIVAKSAAEAERAIKANFSGSHKKGEPHVGGDKPNVVTGTLRRSIRPDTITKFGQSDYGTKVGPRTVYARRVELGYRGSHTVGAHTRKVTGVDGKKRKISVREHTRTFGSEEGGGSGAFPYVEPGYATAKSQMQKIAIEAWRKFLKS